MDTQLIVGLLGLFGAVIAPIVAWKLAVHSEQKQFTTLSNARLNRLNESVWNGYQRFSEDEPIEMMLIFTIKGKKVIGKGSYCHDSLGKTSIAFEGGFMSNDLVKLDYRNSDYSRLHFGTMILKMDGNCSSLDGGILAYGRNPDGISLGTVSLKSS